MDSPCASREQILERLHERTARAHFDRIEAELVEELLPGLRDLLHRARVVGANARIGSVDEHGLAALEIFERHGFIWGGKWYHYDTMHFEYRPELLAPR